MIPNARVNPKSKGKVILVVDDEPRMIGFIRMNLELEDHRVIEAHSGLEAWMKFASNCPIWCCWTS